MKRWKQWKPWKRWMIGILAFFSVFVLTGAGYIYYEVRSIDLEDIQKRNEQREQGAEVAGGGTELPSLLDHSVEKANQIATKPIQAQDALDVAAILLKSGLSLKEVYYLTGKSTDNLSTEEKQKIRDLLLSKLSAEEIKALRAITTEYGKTLIILDPNYPIELVGVYDEAERTRIQKELETSKGKETTSAMPTVNAGPSAIPSETLRPNPTLPAEEQAGSTSSNAKKYKSELDKLQTSCSAKANELLQQIEGSIRKSKSEHGQVSFDQLQTQYLNQIMQAEKDCDDRFQALITQAEKDLSGEASGSQTVETWKNQYNASKEQARLQAIKRLQAVMK